MQCLIKPACRYGTICFTDGVNRLVYCACRDCGVGTTQDGREALKSAKNRELDLGLNWMKSELN